MFSYKALPSLLIILVDGDNNRILKTTGSLRFVKMMTSASSWKHEVADSSLFLLIKVFFQLTYVLFKR